MSHESGRDEPSTHAGGRHNRTRLVPRRSEDFDLGEGFSFKERQEDVARHRAIAAAHEAAAKCIEAKKPEEVCAKELQAACKGIAIGKFCGMRHQH